MKQQKQKVRPVRVGLFNSNKGITYFFDSCRPEKVQY